MWPSHRHTWCVQLGAVTGESLESGSTFGDKVTLLSTHGSQEGPEVETNHTGAWVTSTVRRHAPVRGGVPSAGWSWLGGPLALRAESSEHLPGPSNSLLLFPEALQRDGPGPRSASLKAQLSHSFRPRGSRLGVQPVSRCFCLDS